MGCVLKINGCDKCRYSNSADCEYWEAPVDRLWESIGIFCYNGSISNHLVSVMDFHSDCRAHSVTDTATYVFQNAYPTEVEETYIELLKSILCSHPRLFEYGTSPRTAWMTSWGKTWWEDTKNECNSK